MIKTIKSPFQPSSSALDLPFRKQKLPHRCVWNWTVSELPRWGASAPLWKKAEFRCSFKSLNTMLSSIIYSFIQSHLHCSLLNLHNNQILPKFWTKPRVYLAMTLCRMHVELSEFSSPLELWTTALQPVQKPIG